MSRLRRRLFPALLVGLAVPPTMAVAQDQCRTIRAFTNADDRGFADLSFWRVGSTPRLQVAARGGVPLPAPKDCSFNIDRDETDLSCTWVPRTPAASAELFDSLLDLLRRCLDNRGGPVTGPHPYANARALRESRIEFVTDDGETRLALRLIEAAATPEVAAYHYVSLSVDFEAEWPTEEED